MKKLFASYIFLGLCLAVFAQGTVESSPTSGAGKTSDENGAIAPKADGISNTEKLKPLPVSYRGISLGMSLETVKDALKADAIFGYRGERDFSLLAAPNRSLIETQGSAFIERAWFQFNEESLYTITLKLNTAKVDHYSIYKHFCEKYGEPLDINPHRAIWENETVRITIEKPLTVKYLDLSVFNSMLEKSQTETTKSEKNREAFVEEF